MTTIPIRAAAPTVSADDAALWSTASTAGAVDPWRRSGTLNFAVLPPLAVYVHLPWCLAKCPYCDFNSHQVDPAGIAEDRYVAALIADLDAALASVWGRPVISVFIGGGTPSLFSPAAIERLISALRARLPLVPGCEITLEANPGTFERDRFRAFADAGVTRLSIGVQSFDDGALKALGRVHDAAQARAAVAEAAEVFSTWNLDLMYGLPGQTLAGLSADLDQALAFAPPHLSIYQLTIEANTRFANHPPQLPDDDETSLMLDEIVARADAVGLARYEVSAFARAGQRCKHNHNYWTFGDYLGLGAGAHGKLSFAHHVLRQVRWRDPATYVERSLAGKAVSNELGVARRDLAFEFMLNALRLRDGFAIELFTERTAMPLSAIAGGLQLAQDRGLISREGNWIQPTLRGFDFLSDLQTIFLPD